MFFNPLALITGALYDIYALKHIAEMPTLGYFDIGLRLVIGITTVFYLKKP